ncbi:MAG TPA: sulfite exporter TauE/SafE family protein [Gammaproteobacteria bacterium]
MPLVVVVVATGALLHASIGFGAALFAMPLLALIIDVPTATPLVALVMLTTIAVLLVRDWRHVMLGSVWRLVAGTVLGIPVGLVLLEGGRGEILRIVLGAVLVAYALWYFVRPSLPRIRANPGAWALGFVAGVLGGAYNTNGPPVILYGAAQRWPAARFRATLQGYFLPATVLITAGHGLSGLWTPRVLGLFAWSLPLVVLAALAGPRIGRAIPEERFSTVLHAGLAVVGIILML